MVDNRPLQQMDRLVADAFRRPSWRVQWLRPQGDPQPRLVVEGNGNKYLVEIKRSSEGRRDRVIPLLSQAILEAQAFSSRSPEPVLPVAVVAAQHLPQSVVQAVQSYAERVAPHMVVGLVDAHGLRAFWGHGFEALNTLPSPKQQRVQRQMAGQRLPHLFSDLNQWMLKILLAERISVDLLSAPRGRFKNPSELARVAGVSVMSAFRLVRQLRTAGFLDANEESLVLVRIPDLLSRWSAWREPVQEFPARWLLRRDRTALSAALRSYSAGTVSPRVCLGLFDAAQALGFGFVHGVSSHIYLERFEPAVLHTLGLSIEDAESNPDVFIRIPSNPESVFRAAVVKNQVPCSDILQVWLDVSHHPARGKEQAAEIAHRALAPLLRRK